MGCHVYLHGQWGTQGVCLWSFVKLAGKAAAAAKGARAREAAEAAKREGNAAVAAGDYEAAAEVRSKLTSGLSYS